ncbi:hypothetical protein [Moraxella ovis]|uniref:hypothetical protein n=1 Tax=Moraxella ovis TaxID=29433 RepID=UPI000E021A82|nr:hypothetical protein [Moraxella ovis]STZ31537.1 Uncharacterised protein [Moraxella ovis]
MLVSMDLNVIGASALNFTADDGTVYNHIKIIALADNKGGYGSVGQSFKYDKPSNYMMNLALSSQVKYIKQNARVCLKATVKPPALLLRKLNSSTRTVKNEIHIKPAPFIIG